MGSEQTNIQEGTTPNTTEVASPPKTAELMRAERVAACVAEINIVLETYKCRLVPVVVISGGQMQSRCDIESL